MRNGFNLRMIGLCLLTPVAAMAQGWQVSPARQEVTMRPGDSQTFAIRVERSTGGSGAVRFTSTPRDWDLSRAGETVEAAAGSLPASASGWMTFTPAVFELKQEEYAWVRVTISVPKDAVPGVFRTALFFEEHSVVPQAAEGTRRMVLRYRLSTLIYVVVPKIEKRLEVHSVVVSGSPEEGLSLQAVLENSGTIHLRPQHWVEVADENGKVLVKLDPQPTMPVLPQHQLEVAIRIPKDSLPRAASYTVRYFVDADKELPIKATSVNLVKQP